MLHRRNFLRNMIAGGLGASIAPSLLAQIPLEPCCGSITSTCTFTYGIARGDLLFLEERTGGVGKIIMDYEVPIGIAVSETEILLKGVIACPVDI